ncbi:hypothetical protein LLEC1_04358 [Akanthomyces lecanii]|uniref:Mitochondrial cytochrome c oxidase assembly factor n=1 Tax=Cordyceps confragosa TaxID=2714763 RepID=A0A179I2F6_CORDF|nr:hypothetical protein LLEC1_04358 [Akanthomyces lecanii]
MAGLNLEVFKVRTGLRRRLSRPLGSSALTWDKNHQFGVYVMFPIGIMYYFGTNLDRRFSVPDFWPRPEECNKLPRDREELKVEYDRMLARQRFKQARLEEEERAKSGGSGSDS